MDNTIARIGRTNFRNKHVPFGIKQTDRLAHMLLVGRHPTETSAANKTRPAATFMRRLAAFR